MKIQFREFALLSAFALISQIAQASQDCSTEAKDAVDDCMTITQSAEQANSDLASGVAGNAANVTQGGSNLAMVSDFGRGNLNGASKQCGTDLDTCKKACGDAFQNATDPTVQASVNKNLQSCQKEIATNQSRLATGQTQLAAASAGGQATSAASKFDDSSVDNEKAQTPDDVQQTGFVSRCAAAIGIAYQVGTMCAVAAINPGGFAVGQAPPAAMQPSSGQMSDRMRGISIGGN
jgi:hypothetical protein